MSLGHIFQILWGWLGRFSRFYGVGLFCVQKFFSESHDFHSFLSNRCSRCFLGLFPVGCFAHIYVSAPSVCSTKCVWTAVSPCGLWKPDPLQEQVLLTPESTLPPPPRSAAFFKESFRISGVPGLLVASLLSPHLWRQVRTVTSFPLSSKPKIQNSVNVLGLIPNIALKHVLACAHMHTQRREENDNSMWRSHCRCHSVERSPRSHRS